MKMNQRIAQIKDLTDFESTVGVLAMELINLRLTADAPGAPGSMGPFEMTKGEYDDLLGTTTHHILDRMDPEMRDVIVRLGGLEKLAASTTVH